MYDPTRNRTETDSKSKCTQNGFEIGAGTEPERSMNGAGTEPERSMNGDGMKPVRSRLNEQNPERQNLI